MKSRIVALLAASIATVASGAPADDVAAAVRKLADAPNYTWTIATETIVSDTIGGVTSRYPSSEGPAEAKTEKNGYTLSTERHRTATGGEFITLRAMKDGKTVLQLPNGTWTRFEDLMEPVIAVGAMPASAGAPPPMAAPATELALLVGKVKEFKSADGMLSGEMSAFATTLLLRSAFGESPFPPLPPSSVHGVLRIWLKAGLPVRYEVRVDGALTTTDGNRRALENVETVEIKDVGSTKVDVPAEAKRLLAAIPGKG